LVWKVYFTSSSQSSYLGLTLLQ